MTEQGLRKLSSADKFLMAGNLASIAGVALISIGSLLRMVQRKELPSTIFFGMSVRMYGMPDILMSRSYFSENSSTSG